MSSISIPSTLSSFTDLWSPRLVASVNDQHVKIAKIDGAFIWHAHPDSDELFYLLAGELTMELEDADPVVTKVGDVFVVPKGVRHRPVAKNASIMMVEKIGTVNTGEEVDSERTRKLLDVRS
ncbi:RmlC-like cupin domain-containing protein [Xylariales sp. AK1849]|nr:RmlC-like cupin domain-containing protein [Xylariales sp. AK1849]